MAMEVEIAIVGGGLGGMALALGLQERGIKAHVFEKAPKIRAHTGTAISIAQNGKTALEGIKPGLSLSMEREGAPVYQFTSVIRPPGEAEKVTTTQYRQGNPFMIPWRRSQQMLAASLTEPDVIHWDHTFINYKPVEGGVEAYFEVQAKEDPSTVEVKVVQAKLIVGADGIRSQVRKIMVGDELRDLFLITWNAVVPTESLRSLKLHTNNEIVFIRYDSKNMGVILADCGPGLTLWQVRVADENGEITKAYTSDIEQHGRDVRKVRVMKQIEGFEDLQDLRIAIEGTDPDAVREARAFDRFPLTSWVDPSLRVVLFGDAAHGMYPGPSEGARAAFEDAHQLSILLHEAYSSPSPEAAIPAALKRFEELRISRCAKVQSFAAELTQWPYFIPEWVQRLSTEEKQKRMQEFHKWVRRYPETMSGDPDSTYWKP